MKAFFSRNVPFFLMSPEENTDSDSFDAYPVEVPQDAVDMSQTLRRAALFMNNTFDNNPAPEECAQEEANAWLDSLADVVAAFDGKE